MSNLALRDLAEGVFLPFSIPTMNTSAQLSPAGDLLLGGYSLRETTGTAAAVVEFIDGDGNGGTVVASVSLTPGQSLRDRMPGRGVEIRSNLFLSIISGSVRGSVWVADL